MTSPFAPRPAKTIKSHVVGWALQWDGTRTRAYRAVVAVTCAQCGAAIAPGALFSRHVSPHRAPAPLHTFGPSVAPVPICMTCCPLRLEGDTETTATVDGAEEGPHGRGG